MIIVDLVVLLALSLGVAFFRPKALVWTVVMAVLLVVITVLQVVSWWLLAPAWAVFGVAAVFAHATQLRRNLFTRPLIKTFRKVLPPMSDTEREALEAGKVWWEGELFQGKPNWDVLHNYPKPTLTEEEQTFLDNQVEKACDMLDDWQIVLDGDMPAEVWDYFKKERFFSMLIPTEYGGLGFSALMQSTVVTKLCTRSVSAAVTTMVPNSLGPAELLLSYGTQAQKDHYLPRLARCEEVPCFALTSTEGGSDAGAMPDTGIVCKGQHNGEEVLGIRLNFDKRYITLAPVATLVGLAFKLYDPDHLIGEKKDVGITCALLPADHPGVEIGSRHLPLYSAFHNGPVRGKDVFIPVDWIIGGPEMAGCGWRMLMDCLAVGRGISLPALSAAAGKRCYRLTGAYSKLRQQFKVSIGRFEGVQEIMANIAGFTYMLESCRLMTAGAVDLNAKPSLASAIAKYHMTEMLRDVSDFAMDIHSGRGIQAGPRNYLANLYLSIPVAITVEGANILTRNLMIFGQGAVRCHPYVFDEMQALANDDLKEGLKQFDKLLCGHIGYAISNIARTVYLGLSGAWFAKSPVSGPTAKYYRRMTRMSSALALVSDFCMLIMGGDLKRRENISARLGDVLSYLYLASCVLKYYEDNGKQAEDLVHVKWCAEYCLHNMQEAFYGVFKNFPNKWFGRVLRFVVFPYGRSYEKPSDKLAHQMADMMMQSTALRERLLSNSHVGKTADDVTGRVELAFLKMLDVEPLLKKMQQAMRKGVVPRQGDINERLDCAQKAGIISAVEAESLREFDEMRLDSLAVDEFEPEFFKKAKKTKKTKETMTEKEA